MKYYWKMHLLSNIKSRFWVQFDLSASVSVKGVNKKINNKSGIALITTI